MATLSRTPPANLADLVRTHQAAVWRYLRFLGCDEAGADDLTQETFLAVHRRPFEERSPESTAGYLRTVARNLFLMQVRRGRRQLPTDGFDLDLADEVFARFVRQDGGEAYLDALRDCVAGLSGRARQAVELFYHDDRSRADVARELEMTEDGVKSLLRRTRDLLRKCVEGKVEV
jgi:RNA polymerase sigma-70 factor (ECF subfamily)